MKKILGEYSQIIGYTFAGLVFGLSFFLLFVNFYHYKEVSIKVAKTPYVDEVSTRLSSNVTEVRKNIMAYDINHYTGSENGYELLSVQSRLNLCADAFEDDRLKSILNKQEISISDIYHLEALFQQNIINECVLKQLYPLTFKEGNEFKFKSNSIRMIAPFIKLESDSLAKSTRFISSNMKNNSNYYFGNQDSRDNIFDVTSESYYEILNSYEEASKFLLELSKWYMNVTGGVA